MHWENIVDITEKKEKINEETIFRAQTHIFAEERKGYEAGLARVTSIQQKCLVAVAKKGGKNTASKEFIACACVVHPSTIKKALERLVDLKILCCINGEYRLVNPFFAEWLVSMNY